MAKRLGLLGSRFLSFSSVRSHAATVSVGTNSVLAQGKSPWKIATAICVQRYPIVSKEKSELEKSYLDMKFEQANRISVYSDYELEEQEYLQKKKEREQKAMEDSVDIAAMAKLDGGLEFEEQIESRLKELKAYVPSPRVTKDDKANNTASLNRKLDEMLYLLVKQPRAEFAWKFPQVQVDMDTSLTESAKHGLSSLCGSELKCQFISNAPVAYHAYTYTDQPYIGTKLFFMKSQYLSGDLLLDTDQVESYAWVTKDEMKDYVSSDYFKAISPVLY